MFRCLWSRTRSIYVLSNFSFQPCRTQYRDLCHGISPERHVSRSSQCPFPALTLPHYRLSQHPYIGEPGLSKVLRLARNAPLSEFQRACSQGIPVVVTGVDAGLHGDWGPEYFIERYGSHKVTLVDCESECTRQSTVALFFQDFLNACDRRQILKLKVRTPTSVAVPSDACLTGLAPTDPFSGRVS